MYQTKQERFFQPVLNMRDQKEGEEKTGSPSSFSENMSEHEINAVLESCDDKLFGHLEKRWFVVFRGNTR